MKQKEIFLELVGLVQTLTRDLALEEMRRVKTEQKFDAPKPIDTRDIHNLMKAVAGNRKIEAIKAYRSLTGFGLVQSKDAVEAAFGTVAK